jgi:TatD DNase family protein
MELFDSHCHLDSKDLRPSVDAVLDRAAAAGVTRMCTIGVSRFVREVEETIALARRYPGRVCVSVGLHPHDAAHLSDEEAQKLAELAAAPDVVAIGEIGLDYHYDLSPREKQRERFREWLNLARQLKKPVSIHTREADQDTLDILREEKAHELGGVLHCFSHSEVFGKAALDLGFYLSIPGVVTFKKSEELRSAVKNLPLDRMMVETDSPYLAPVPMRGKTNEPAFVRHTAQAIAALKGVSLEEVAEVTTRNARALYGV